MRLPSDPGRRMPDGLAWQKLPEPRPQVTTIHVSSDPVLGGCVDGYPHRRTGKGFCITCGARSGEAHYRIRPDRSGDTPLYYETLAERRMRSRGLGPLTMAALATALNVRMDE